MNNFYAVIMAGGGGTRLWPLSTKAHPKQMLKIIQGHSLFQIAVDRLVGLFTPDQVFIVTVEDQLKELSAQAPNLPSSNFLIEPMPRGTASVVGLAAVHLLRADQNAVMAVLTADHVIRNIPRFHDLLRKARDLAEQGYLITLGIEPSYAATGYGYIQAAEQMGSTDAYLVEKFTEKPEKEVAEEFLQAGSYYWNSGMFIWRAERILSEFARQMPDEYDKLMAISSHLGMSDADQFVRRIWPEVEKQTIDYGIMENAGEVIVLPARDLDWEDVGSWDSMFDLLDADEKGNIVRSCRDVLIDSENLLVFGDDPDKLVAAIGLEDLIVVNCKNSLLICRKGDSQRVKEIIDQLKDNNLDSYL